MKAYHFLQADMCSGEGNEPPWIEGETRTLEGEIIPCQRGYHAAPSPLDALQYAPGPVLCLVELGEGAVAHGDPVDKYASRTRTLLKAVNIERELRLFAADCAERVLPLYEVGHPGDDRLRAAIQAARDYAEGRIGAAALDAALDAAWAAARAAARAAAWAAATAAATAAARAAATAAARAAATDAAWAAARAAATDAAWAAARAAARDAAWAAEREWQRERFNTLAYGLLGVGREK